MPDGDTAYRIVHEKISGRYIMKKFKTPKILTEFKEFITRGNVMGLAVGMIIGAAFTAIVNALVNSILKPLINAVPLGDVSGLITMLVPKDADGVELVGNFNPALIDLSKSVYIDWGAFIMAIITFLLTALVLFFILKAVTSVQKGFGSVKGELGLLSSEEAEELRRQGKSRREIKAILAERAAEAQAKAEAEAAAAKPETTDDLLREIRDLLRAQAEQSAKNDKPQE